MDNNNNSIPQYFYEDTCARFERSHKRMFIALVVAVALLFASNMLWLWAWTQYEYVGETTTYTQDGEGVNIIGDDNGVNYPAERTNPDDQAEDQAEKVG